MYAIVTGASSGMGLEYARQLAGVWGYDLLMISNQDVELAQAAEEIRQATGVAVETLCMDLSVSSAAQEIVDFIDQRGLDIEVLINNAGILVFDTLNRVPARKIDTLIGLHVLTVTQLNRLIGERLCQRGKGYILNMSSMTAWTALPTIQAYNATKAYILNLSKSLWYEMAPYGVHVLAVCPGSVNTGLLPFPDGMAKIMRSTGLTMQPDRLVRGALKALLRSKHKVYLPGAWNRFVIVPVLKHLPDWVVRIALKRLGFIHPNNSSPTK